jgi:ankyrin repeat protein
VAEWLIAAGADIEAENEGTSVLNQCIIRADSPSALFLLERRASVHSKTADGKSALTHAIKADLEDVVFKLCALGAEVNEMDDKGTTPLWLALQQKKEKIAFILVR